jgi:dolichol-phosphate mannosyltransferase
MADRRAVVVVPTYNEAQNITRLLAEVHAVVPGVDVLVVDDGSPDGTGEIVARVAAADGRVRLMSRAGKQGLGTAYVAGFRDSLERGYDLICQMDCDFSHQPRYLADFLREIEAADVVVGSRYVKGGETENWPLKRRVLSLGGNLYARTILGVPYKDLTGGFKCWRRQVLEAIDLGTVRGGTRSRWRWASARSGRASGSRRSRSCSRTAWRASRSWAGGSSGSRWRCRGGCGWT